MHTHPNQMELCSKIQMEFCTKIAKKGLQNSHEATAPWSTFTAHRGTHHFSVASGSGYCIENSSQSQPLLWHEPPKTLLFISLLYPSFPPSHPWTPKPTFSQFQVSLRQGDAVCGWQVRQKCPIFSMCKASKLLCLFTPKEALLTTIFSGIKRTSSSVSRWDNCGTFP